MGQIKAFESSAVVKAFFRQFSSFRIEFLDIITKQIELHSKCQQYAQLFFNRIFVLTFIQSRGIFENNTAILENYLQISQSKHENYYTTFFLPFIFKKASQNPTLNFALFTYQLLDQEFQNLLLPNEFFIRFFEFLREYSWELVETKENKDHQHITPEILGFIFEQTLNARSEFGMERKETGTYYTPKKITSYITHETVQGYLEHKLSKEIPTFSLKQYYEDPQLSLSEEVGNIFFEKIFPNLSILDNSCGSGAFLIAALDELILWAQIFLFPLFQQEKHQQKIIHILGIPIEKTKSICWTFSKIEEFKSDFTWRFWIKRKIIQCILFGTDLDETAVQITKVRLWLSVLTEQLFMKDKILPTLILDENIQVGNALFGFHNEDQILIKKITQKKQLDSFYWETNQLTNIETSEKPELFHWILAFPKIFIDTPTPGFAIILGNPPYGNLLSSTEAQICQQIGYPTSEIAATFLERSLDLQQEDGFLGQITTFAITFSKELSKTRKKIISSYKQAQIASFDRDKCRFFAGMTQSVAIIFCKEYHKNQTKKLLGKIFTSKMYRTMPNLSTLEFEDTDSWLLTKNIGGNIDEIHRLPKLGNKMSIDILTQLMSKNEKNNLDTIGNLVDPPKKNQKKAQTITETGSKRPLWVRISGNYWYNVWDFHPYESTQILPLHLKSNTTLERSFILVLMNSSLFYLWCRIYGDGRHMNMDIMNAFPISTTVKQKMIQNENLLKTTASWIMNIMHQHYDPVRKCFPSSKFKFAIDFCDEILAILYDLQLNQLQYIQNYDAEIRGGIQIPENIHNKVLKLSSNYSFIEFNSIVAELTNINQN